MMETREHGEVRVGDLIEFAGRPEYAGIITNMMSKVYGDVPECHIGDADIAAFVVHQASDGKFAVWEVDNLGECHITFRRRAN